MESSSLFAVSPVDGRYAGKTAALRDYFSEAALIRYRIMVEVEYLLALRALPLPQLDGVSQEKLRELCDLYMDFKPEYAERVKAIEKTTNHDVKAVEYFVKEQLDAMGLSDIREFTHFGLTSQDINNTAFPSMLRDATVKVYLPLLREVVEMLRDNAKTWKEIPMLARTHGQPASPTCLGKEIYVFVERLEAQINLLHKVPFSAKFGGATGNFNAHHVAYPNIDWVAFANRFLNDKLGLEREQTTTQIDHYDNLAAIFDNMRRINTILIDFCRDMWTYISMGYFGQVVVQGEVGSSAMPHKVNPIDFENAEGNLGMANAVFVHLASKLPVSRLQRDLTDSTVIRNIGVPLAHSIIAFQSIEKGLNRVSVNDDEIDRDLTEHWVVVSEGIQTILRREGYPHAYEALKGLTRTATPPRKSEIMAFIESLKVPEAVKEELRAITPQNYTGIQPDFE